MVLQFQYDSFEYASALLLLEKSNATRSHFTIGAAGKKDDLLCRVELILGIPKKPVVSFNKVTGLFAGLFCIIALNALLVKKEPVNKYRAASVADIPAAAGFVSQSFTASGNHPVAEYAATHSIQNRVRELIEKKLQEARMPSDAVPPAVAPPAMIHAAYEPLPELSKYQEEQVKEALQASKKVLESAQWKAVEKSIADVFTQKEKEEIRSDYQKELNNFDWKQWENRLRAAYDQVDWEKVNYQFTNAINQVRIDSLQSVYNNAMAKLSDVEKELTIQKLNGIPDSDITLRVIEDKKRQAQRALNSLRTVRTRRIVHL